VRVWRADLRPITDAGLEHLKGLASLEKLNHRNTKITAAGAKKPRETLPKMQ